MMVAATKDQEPMILKDLNHTTCTRWHPDAMDIIPATGGKGIGTKKSWSILVFLQMKLWHLAMAVTIKICWKLLDVVLPWEML